jgi:hypothetical protein
MADKRMVKLVTKAHRHRALALISAAPEGYVVTIQEPTRTLDQNARLWAMLSDISAQKPLGRKHTPDDWKAIFCNACGWEVQFTEGLDGRPFPVGFRTSRMTKAQMADLISYIQAFGDEQGVRWSEPNPYD